MIISLDLETTGTDARRDAIIEIGLVRCADDGTVLDTFSALVDPGIPLTPDIVNITGITDEMLRGAPRFDSLRSRVAEFIGTDTVLLGHNIDFDISFLREQGYDFAGHRVMDTFHLAQICLYDQKSFNLATLVRELGGGIDDEHRALADAQHTVVLYRQIADRVRTWDADRLALLDFVARRGGGQDSLSVFLDIAGISRPEERITGEQAMDMILSHRRHYPKISLHTAPEHTYTAPMVLASARERDPTVEERPEQERMAMLVEATLKENRKVVAEAPTGLGKTFAYLVPSILFSLRKGMPVFISTHTKILQDQILGTDVPRIRGLLAGLDPELDFSAVKIKGRNNYISLVLFSEYLTREMYTPEEVVFVGKIVLWLLTSESGELEDLSFFGREYEYLDGVRAMSGFVLSKDNPYRKQEPLFLARNDTQKANIIVINHALLATEAETDADRRILPDIRHLIVDEMHMLEDVVTSTLRERASLPLVDRALHTITETIRAYARKAPTGEAFLFPEMRSYHEAMVLDFGIIFDFVADRSYGPTRANLPEGYPDRLLPKDIRDDISWQTILRTIHTLRDRMREYMEHMYRAPETLFGRIETAVTELERYLHVIEVCLLGEDPEKIRIVSYDYRDSSTILIFTERSVGAFLADRLWSHVDACVGTSATLTIGQSFDYISRTVGLDSFEKELFTSDFDYASQALVFCPSNIWDLRQPRDRAKIFKFMEESIRAMGGRTLCLFTSFASIREAYLATNAPLKGSGITVLAQGMGTSRHRMISSFRRDAGGSVIFGTESFWQGVDIPGDDLSLLMIYKFPFLVPTDPIVVARSALYRDVFKEYSMPAMLMRLRQGIGRLIRTRSDRGIIVILDARIHSEWAASVRADMPRDIRFRVGTTEQFLEMLQGYRERKEKEGGK